MAIKYRLELTEYDTLDDSIKANYVEKDGSYILDLEGNDVEKTRIALQKERDIAKAAQQKSRELQAKFEEELSKKTAPKKEDSDVENPDIEKTLKKRMDAKMFSVNEELEELRAKNAASESQLKAMAEREKNLLLKEGIGNIVSKNPKFTASAAKMLYKFGAIELEYDESRETFSSKDFATLQDWVDSQVVEYPMLYKPSIGAGAQGGKDGVKKNLTLQDQIREKHNKATQGK